MFRHLAFVAAILSLTLLMETAHTLGAGKPDPVAERLADELAAYEVLAISFERPSVGKGVKAFAIRRFSLSAEPIELQYARCLSITQDGNLGSPTLKDLVKVKVSLDTSVLKELLKNPKFVETFLKARLAIQAAEDKADLRKAFDEWEIRYNNQLTSEIAGKHLVVAALVDSVTTKEHRETRKLLRDQILKALADNPETLKKLAQGPEPSDELRKSRERVRELMEQTRKN